MIKHPELKAKFDNLKIGEKYAFVFHVELYFRFLQNRIESEDVQDQLVVGTILALVDEVLEYLGFTEDDIDKALEYDENSLIPPLTFLQNIKDKSILNILLDTCSTIVESTTGDLEGMDKYSFAKKVLFENFRAIGFSDDEIEESIKRVYNSGLV